VKIFELKVEDKMLDAIAEDENLRAMEIPQAFLRAMKFVLKLKKAPNRRAVGKSL
jgi:hypothetical protein